MKPKPTLREEAKLEVSSAAAHSAIRVLEMVGNYPYKTCVRCDNFNLKDELCKLYSLRPPAEIIAFGCEKYDDDEWVPF